MDVDRENSTVIHGRLFRGFINAPPLKRRISDFSYFSRYFLEIVHQLITFYRNRHISQSVLVRQILFTGYEALGIVSLIALAIGGIIVLEGNAILPGFSQSPIFYKILITVVIRELSCLLTAFIIVARSGTAIATELGNMVINHEVDALVSFGISPISYLVVPRIFGVTISLIILTTYFNAVALFGAWAMGSVSMPSNPLIFLYAVFNEIVISDIVSSLLKTLLFGFFVAMISSYEGLQVSLASTEVPQRTIKAVVKSLTIIIIVDVTVTALFYIF